MKLKTSLLISLVLLFAGCDTHHHSRKHQDQHIGSYRTKDSSGDWVYWYIIYSSMNNSTPVATSYYSSSVPVSNFRGATFTPVSAATPAPKELEQVIEEQQPTEVQVNQETAPEQLELDLNDPNTETVDTQAESDSVSDASDSSASDSGSSDSGGGDGGSGE